MMNAQGVAGRWERTGASLALVPGIVFALLPRGTCPACLAAYSSLLSALGVGALYQARLVTPLTLTFLAVGVLSMTWSRRSHRRWGPLLATVGGSVGVLAGRFLWDWPILVTMGVAALVAASLWNLWLKRPLAARLVQIRPASGRLGEPP